MSKLSLDTQVRGETGFRHEESKKEWVVLKAVIFDVGGVLIRTHSRAGREKWAAQLGLDSWEFEHLVFNGDSGRQAQLGRQTHAAHWRWLGERFGLSAGQLVQMEQDFFAGDKVNEPLLEYIKRLRQTGYRTGLLSNYTDAARRLWTEVYPFIQYFDGVVISAEVGVMKPHPRSYHLALESLGVVAAEALFVDDFAENIAGASAAGMQTLHFTDPALALRQLAEMTGVDYR